MTGGKAMRRLRVQRPGVRSSSDPTLRPTFESTVRMVADACHQVHLHRGYSTATGSTVTAGATAAVIWGPILNQREAALHTPAIHLEMEIDIAFLYGRVCAVQRVYGKLSVGAVARNVW